MSETKRNIDLIREMDEEMLAMFLSSVYDSYENKEIGKNFETYESTLEWLNNPVFED